MTRESEQGTLLLMTSFYAKPTCTGHQPERAIGRAWNLDVTSEGSPRRLERSA